LLDVLDAARADLDRLSGAVSGRVALAAVASAAATFVSGAVSELRDTHPGIEVSVVATEPARSEQLLLAGDVDVAVVDEYDGVPLALPEGCAVRELALDRLVTVLPRGSLRRRSLAAYAGASWVMPPEDAACGRAVRVACRAAGFEPRVTWETDDMLLLVRAVADGHGVAVLPRRSVADGSAAVELGELRAPALTRRLLAVARTGAAARPVVTTVLDALTKAAGSPAKAAGSSAKAAGSPAKAAGDPAKGRR
jgi:DNA-binding transcriptional LysR family regulator